MHARKPPFAHRPHLLHAACLAVACLSLPVHSLAQASKAQPGIYTCVDGKGRRITADRPITDCLDREQRELSPSGTVRRVLGPSLTAEERAQEDIRKKAEADKQARVNEERRKERSLLVRYPNQASHDQARAEALEQINSVLLTIRKREEELDTQEQALNDELEFYRKDPAKAPSWLKRRKENLSQQRAAQANYLADQQREMQRINDRYDEELVILRKLWGSPAPTTAPAL